MRIDQYYRVLFSLPGIWLSILLLVVGVTANILVNRGLAATTLYVFMLLVLDTVYLYRVGSPLRRPRRNIALHGVVALYVATASFFIDPAAAMAASATLLFIVVYATIRYTPVYYAIPFAAAAASLIALGRVEWLAATVVDYAAVTLLDIVIYLWLRSHGIRGTSIAEIARLYLENWLERGRSIEGFFHRISGAAEVEYYVLDSPRVSIIHPDIHYGPFSNIGSSMFPSMLAKGIAKPVIVLHGMGSHNRNIPRGREAEEYAAHLIRVIAENQGIRVYPGKPYRVNGPGGWTALVVPFTMASIAFITRPGGGIDDLPYELQEYMNRLTSMKGLYPVILVDSHNWERGDPMDLEELYTLLEAIAEEQARRGTSYTTQYYIGVGRAPGRSEDGVNGEVTVFMMKLPDTTLCITYIPGNNMEPGVRDKLLSLMIREGCIEGEVITNDEHIETGTRPGQAYIPVRYSEELEAAVAAAIRGARRSLEETPLTLKHGHYTVRLMMGYAWRLLGTLRLYFKQTAIILLSYTALSPFLLALINTALQITR